MRGTGFVARDWVEEELTGRIDGERVMVRAKFAGLEGYLMAKAFAVRHRGLDRDCYDLAFVLIYNRAGGPAQAAELLRGGEFAADVKHARAVWHEIEERFADTSAFGPRSYAEQALLVDPDADSAGLRQNAVGLRGFKRPVRVAPRRASHLFLGSRAREYQVGPGIRN